MSKRADVMFQEKLPFMGSELNRIKSPLFLVRLSGNGIQAQGHMPVSNINALGRTLSVHLC